MKYLLHGSTIVDFLRGQPHVVSRLKSAIPIELGVAATSVMELQYGFFMRPDLTSRTEAVFNALLSVVNIVEFELADARESARILAEAQARGQTISAVSAQLCGLARRRDLALIVASRTSEPHALTAINGLRLIDWGLPAI
jgi:predicted nucleic acid-binding protein